MENVQTRDLNSFPIFSGLQPDQLDMLAPIFWRQAFLGGQAVFEQGDQAINIYVVERGEVGLEFRPYDGGHMHIETITPGGVFGWSAALGRAHYTSSAICQADASLIVTRGSDLRRVMRRDRELAAVLLDSMAQIVAHRLDSFRQQLIRLLGAEADGD